MNQYLLNKVYKKYAKELYLYIYSMCKNKELAEDLMQETFVKAIMSLNDTHTNVRAWLYMVARNLYFNEYNKQKNIVDISDDEVAQIQTDDEILNRIISSERNRLLYKMMKKLDDKKREVLTLQYFAELSQKEISNILKITPENVRVLSYRAKKELKKLMEETGYAL